MSKQGPYIEGQTRIVRRYTCSNQVPYTEERQTRGVWRYKRSNQEPYTEEGHTRMVWRYKRSNQEPYTKDGMITQWQKEKTTKGHITIYKILQRKLKIRALPKLRMNTCVSEGLATSAPVVLLSTLFLRRFVYNRNVGCSIIPEVIEWSH